MTKGNKERLLPLVKQLDKGQRRELVRLMKHRIGRQRRKRHSQSRRLN